MLKYNLAMHLHKNCWIEKSQTDRSPISGWFCGCKVGARTVWCCAHDAIVLWYLGYARNQPHNLVSSTNPQIQVSGNTIKSFKTRYRIHYSKLQSVMLFHRFV